MQSYEDHFSEKASEYASYRPGYPAELFTYLASISPARNLAWDAGTGSGQAARELVNHFQQVIATDASSDQIANAFQHERIEYRVETAEDVSLETGSVDLVTVGTAVHWFDLPRFYQTVRRVAVEGGILAVWAYHLPVIDPSVDPILYRFYKEVLAGYWPERFRYIDDRYQSLPFPFKEMNLPPFTMQAEWNLHQLTGFLESWSGSKRYQAALGQPPTRVIAPDLWDAWGDPDQSRQVRWPLNLRVGQV